MADLAKTIRNKRTRVYVGSNETAKDAMERIASNAEAMSTLARTMATDVTTMTHNVTNKVILGFKVMIGLTAANVILTIIVIAAL